MTLYHNLFYTIYSFAKSIERGYWHQDNSNRAFGTVTAISLLQLANLLTLNPAFFTGVWLYGPLIILFGINFFFFFYKKRYLKVVEEQKRISKDYYRYISIAYVFISIIAHLYTNL